MDDPVAAIPEAAATGEIAALFADIRATLGVGAVNLIWRHLATIPGALPWAWHAVRPAYADGRLAALAAGLQGRLAIPEPVPLPAEVAIACGLAPADGVAIGAVLAAYGRTNPLALLALSALALRLEGAVAPASSPTPAMSGASATTPARLVLPALPDAGALHPATVALIQRLNRLGALREDAVLATMYRHLAHWPAALALAWTVLAPPAADGRLAAAIRACRAAARDAAASLALAPAHPPLPAGQHAAVADALDRFGGEVLPRMVVACAVLRRAGLGQDGRGEGSARPGGAAARFR